MAELDKIPQKQSIEIETVKIDEDTYKSIQDLNSEIGQFVGRFGEIYLRKKEIQEELIRLDDASGIDADDWQDVSPPATTTWTIQ